MCSRKPWRFLLIAFIPAALTAALLSAVAGPNAGRCQKPKAAASQAADVQQVPQDNKTRSAPTASTSGAPAFTQLTSWYDDQKLRAWFAQHSGTTCESTASDKHTCQFVKPRRLSIVIPERADATLDSQLPLLAQTLAAAPPDVQVDIIHYRNANALPVQNIQPTDVAELMLCAKLPQPQTPTPPSLYQSCIDALSPRLNSPLHKPAHFWQVTLAPFTSKASNPTNHEQSPSLQSLLNTLQPQPQTALIALGHWTPDEILGATENINPAIHLTVLTSQAPQSTPLRACGLSSAAPPTRVPSPKPLSTPASLAVLSTDTANAQALTSAVWRRYQLQPKEVATRDCGTRQGACGLSGGPWYASYLRLLLLWYSVGLICLFALWSARRTPPTNQAPK